MSVFRSSNHTCAECLKGWNIVCEEQLQKVFIIAWKMHANILGTITLRTFRTFVQTDAPPAPWRAVSQLVETLLAYFHAPPCLQQPAAAPSLNHLSSHNTLPVAFLNFNMIWHGLIYSDVPISMLYALFTISYVLHVQPILSFLIISL
jgi:hypothetical protein